MRLYVTFIVRRYSLHLWHHKVKQLQKFSSGWRHHQTTDYFIHTSVGPSVAVLPVTWLWGRPPIGCRWRRFEVYCGWSVVNDRWQSGQWWAWPVGVACRTTLMTAQNKAWQRQPVTCQVLRDNEGAFQQLYIKISDTLSNGDFKRRSRHRSLEILLACEECYLFCFALLTVYLSFTWLYFAHTST